MVKSDTQAYIAKMCGLRDIKVHEHLLQYAPIWMIDEEADPNKDALSFKVVFYHPTYGWVRRRYWFDAYTDVLHQGGQVTIDEDAALAHQLEEPYLDTNGGNSMSSYGG